MCVCVCVCFFRYSLFVYLFHIYFNLVTVYYGQISNKRYILRHLLKGSVYHSPTMGHPNKRAVRKLSYYESSHENMSSLFVHVIPHSCNSAVLKLFDTWSYQSLVILFFYFCCDFNLKWIKWCLSRIPSKSCFRRNVF